MAPLDPTSTKRVRYTYENAVAEHAIEFRVVTTAAQADVDEIMQVLMTNLGPAYVESTITAVDAAAIGSNIFLPVSDSTLLGDSFGSGAAGPETNSIALTFVGRSSAGRRTRFSLFGYKNALSDYRLTSAEAPSIATIVAFLNDPDTPLLAIDGNAPVFKPYADIKANDHWVRVARA